MQAIPLQVRASIMNARSQTMVGFRVHAVGEAMN